MEIGKKAKLKIARMKDFGAYLEDPADTGEPEEGKRQAVLLPIRQVPEGARVGDEVEVFLYKDSADRRIATTAKPHLTVGETALLQVKECTPIGAFVDIGLEKDVLLPYKEMTGKVEEKACYLLALYVDRSDRLAVTMRIYPYLSSDSPYKKDDVVQARVYQVGEKGVFVAVEDRYFGLIPPSELYQSYKAGDIVSARVLRVREDGKLDLSPRQKAYLQTEEDAEKILSFLKDRGGRLGFGEKASSERIKASFQMSKNAFKRAVGNLLKTGKIILSEDDIKLKE